MLKLRKKGKMQITHCDFCREMPAKRLHLQNGDKESFVMDVCLTCLCDRYIDLLNTRFSVNYKEYMNKLCDDVVRATD